MATNTYVALQTQTLSSVAASVTFSSISQAYTDLRIVAQAGNASGISAVGVRYNSDSGSNYSWTRLYGDGSSVTSNRNSDTAAYFGIIGTAIGQTFTVDIMNYSNTTTYKTAISRSSDAANYVATYVNLWRGSTGSATQAITSLTFLNSNGGNFLSGSTFTLYGIAKGAEVPTTAKATGGTITYGIDYTYHTFTSSGTFTPNQALSCDLLVVAGGAGGGGSDSSGRTAAGGGGAGGYLEQTGRSVTATAYTVTIGAGGPQGTSAAAQTPSLVTRGVNGNNSVFDTSTAIGGGGGAGGGGTATINGTPTAGGSGGGGNVQNAVQNGAAATQGNSGGATGYGFAGGNGVVGGTGSYQAGSGGGGAGSVGADGLSSSNSTDGYGGVGGSGRLSSINGVPTYYAAGGSGANEGSAASNTSTNSIGGAGGRGATSTNPTAGVANTGSGGGGSSYQGTGGSGGSGIVIIRYAN